MLSRKDWQGIWLGGGAVAAVAAVLLLKASLDSAPKPGSDNCVGVVTSNTVVLLDHSEQMSAQTRAAIVDRAMSHIAENVKVNDRVTIFAVSEISKNALAPLVSLCRPPDSGNRLIENPELLRKRFQQSFARPIREALNGVPGDTRESPIAQAVADISLSQYLRSNSNTLLIFSDLLENTNVFTLYGCSSSADVIARYRVSRRGAMERPRFKDTTIVVNLIPRLGQSIESMKCRDVLWAWFFGDNVKGSVSIDHLPGGPVGPSVSGSSK